MTLQINNKLGFLISKLLNKNIVKLASVNFSSSLGSKERKRFFKNVTVCESSSNSNQFEINLDNKKLKTPNGKVLQVSDELLANMISQEWQSQKSVLKQTTMHLTSLTNTCIDNPNKLTKESIVQNLLEYLSTDTLLFFESNNLEKLNKEQEEKWRPVVAWFNHKFKDMNLTIHHDIDQNVTEPTLNNKNENSFTKYLNNNFDLNTLIALNYMSECLKSVIISIALLEAKIPSVDEACNIANLEQNFQNDQWGRVEWYHDINESELKSRVSASLLFIYLTNKSTYLVSKNISKQ